MNWYKYAKISTFMEIVAAIGLLAATVFLANKYGFKIDKEEAQEIIRKNNNNPTLVQKEIENKALNIVQKNPITMKKQKDQEEFDFKTFYKNKILPNEGIRYYIYDDGRGNPTIGVGHLITKNSRDIFNELFGRSIDFDKILSGQLGLTKEQVEKLAKYDSKKHLERAKKIFNNFDNYPVYLQYALLDSVYRGDTGPKTTVLINQGKWEEAAKEYLNRYDYKNADQLGIPGIKSRMESNQKAFLQYANELKTNARN